MNKTEAQTEIKTQIENMIFNELCLDIKLKETNHTTRFASELTKIPVASLGVAQYIFKELTFKSELVIGSSGKGDTLIRLQYVYYYSHRDGGTNGKTFSRLFKVNCEGSDISFELLEAC